MREREQMFTEFLGELKKGGGKQHQQQQKDPPKTKVEKVSNFFSFLLFSPFLFSNSSFPAPPLSFSPSSSTPFFLLSPSSPPLSSLLLPLLPSLNSSFLLQVKQEFMAMLGESQQDISEQSQWKKIKGSFDHDPRYKAVETSAKREEFFLEYQKSLKSKDQVCVCVWVCMALKCAT